MTKQRQPDYWKLFAMIVVPSILCILLSVLSRDLGGGFVLGYAIAMLYYR